jgi:hypothetical protein
MIDNNNTSEKIKPEGYGFGTDEPMMLGDLLDSLDSEKEAKKRKLDLDLDTLEEIENNNTDMLRSVNN